MLKHLGWIEKSCGSAKDNGTQTIAPKAYPCLGFFALVSFCYEETKPGYLYLEDLRAFLAAMETE